MAPSLADLRHDQRAILRSVTGARAYRRRLLELGFLPGTEVRMVRNIPIGDVLEVELRHSRVSLRISEARAIVIDPPGDGAGPRHAARGPTPEAAARPGAPPGDNGAP